jgi:hypothetical protein
VLELGAACLLRMTKLTYLLRSAGWRRRTALNPTAVRLASFFFWMGLLAHWLACSWIFLGGPTADS